MLSMKVGTVIFKPDKDNRKKYERKPQGCEKTFI